MDEKRYYISTCKQDSFNKVIVGSSIKGLGMLQTMCFAKNLILYSRYFQVILRIVCYSKKGHKGFNEGIIESTVASDPIRKTFESMYKILVLITHA